MTYNRNDYQHRAKVILFCDLLLRLGSVGGKLSYMTQYGHCWSHL